ncbi:hypothetical protein VP1G_10590 [Cytospora mali]|uniref:Uncharacterized protein n=1 Tax=Cytospora mali TaxID=578113 RepID=A0A194UPE0_CYTMA|nr:hypothetical protein VP1G_10590 [Valsa mali var. pyri (nom. inval.)]
MTDLTKGDPQEPQRPPCRSYLRRQETLQNERARHRHPAKRKIDKAAARTTHREKSLDQDDVEAFNVALHGIASQC